MNVETEIANILLDKDAVKLRPDKPFKYTSGMLAPIYTDNRILISHPDARKVVVKAFTDIVKSSFNDVEVIAGTSTAGIPWAAWIAKALDLPMVYIRSKAKGHGRENKIEGVLNKNSQTLVVEDLITTGGSALSAVEAVREAGGNVLAVLAIFTYEMKVAVDNFEKANTTLHFLTTFRDLIEVATDQGILSSEGGRQTLEWAEDPEGWGTKMGHE